MDISRVLPIADTLFLRRRQGVYATENGDTNSLISRVDPTCLRRIHSDRDHDFHTRFEIGSTAFLSINNNFGELGDCVRPRCLIVTNSDRCRAGL